MSRLTAQEWSNHFDRLQATLDGANSINARSAAESFANAFYDDSYLNAVPLLEAARALPSIGGRNVGRGITLPSAPQARSERFDAGMEFFKNVARAALKERFVFEQAIAVNQGLSRGECRRLVHEFPGTQRERVYASVIVAETRLSGDQTLDALEQLEEEGLLHHDTIKITDNWLTRLNSKGRNLLDGTKPARPDLPLIQIAQQFNIPSTTHPAHTPEDARQAFLTEMPRMRSEFKKNRAELLSEIFHVDNYPAVLPQRMLDLAEEELHRRLDLSSEKVEQLLESGWMPATKAERREALRGCFMGAEMHNDPWSDIYAAVDSAYDHMPSTAPTNEPSLRTRLGQVQTWASEAAFNRVETYVVKNKPSVNINNNAPVASQQVGDNNRAFVNQSVVSDNRSLIHTAISEIEKRIDEFPAGERDEVREHLEAAKAELATENPRKSKVLASIKAVGRAAREYSLDAIKSIAEGVASGLS